MKNICQSLPGIAQIGYCLCENIQPNIVLKYSSGIPVGVFTEITPVRFFGQPSYDAVEEYDNNGRKVLCTLKFVSNDNIPLHKHLAFVITDASGTSFIIGSSERPYPIVKSSATSGNPSGESNATTYEIKWSSVEMNNTPSGTFTPQSYCRYFQLQGQATGVGAEISTPHFG